MIDYNFWLVFTGASIALNVAPGPDVIYILTKTLSGGKKIGIASVLGVCTGALFHVVIAALGLSAILVTSQLSFTVVKYIGACYLLYLGYKAFRSSGATFDINEKKEITETMWGAFKQGILIDVLNPKVAIFFMAFLPQFLRAGHGSISYQLLYLGLLVILMAMIVEMLYVLIASAIANKFINNKKYGIWLDRIVGTIFVGLGAKLIASKITY